LLLAQHENLLLQLRQVIAQLGIHIGGKNGCPVYFRDFLRLLGQSGRSNSHEKKTVQEGRNSDWIRHKMAR
jgi:hypothetical protein